MQDVCLRLSYAVIDKRVKRGKSSIFPGEQAQKPARGVEPPTYGLRNHCSTTELRWRYNQGL